MGIATVNPTTLETLQSFSALTPETIQLKLAQSEAAFQSYRQTSFTDRSQWLLKAADMLENPDKSQEYAALMTLEMGKPIQEALGEVKKCAWVCRYYAEQAPYF